MPFPRARRRRRDARALCRADRTVRTIGKLARGFGKKIEIKFV